MTQHEIPVGTRLAASEPPVQNVGTRLAASETQAHFATTLPKRKTPRAPWHDYNGGIYFVTICCHNRQHYLGKIMNAKINLSTAGNLVKDHCMQIPTHYNDVEFINYVIMPNHVHIMIAIDYHKISSLQPKGCLAKVPTDDDQDFHCNSRLARIVGSFKSGISREINKIGIEFKWQKRYHEHIIRTRVAYDRIYTYIDNNVINWEQDCFFC